MLTASASSQDVAALCRLDVSIGILPQQQALSNQSIGRTIDGVDKAIMIAVAQHRRP
jgi:hypothetical protein